MKKELGAAPFVALPPVPENIWRLAAMRDADEFLADPELGVGGSLVPRYQ